MDNNPAHEAHFDQLLTAMQKAHDAAWRNAHLVEHHVIEDLLMEAQRRFRNGVDEVAVRVVPTGMPAYSQSGWEEGTLAEPELLGGFSKVGHDPADAPIPTEGRCVWHFDPLAAADGTGWKFGPVRVLWVPVPPLLVQFEFCHDCADSIEKEYGPLDWRQPNGQM